MTMIIKSQAKGQTKQKHAHKQRDKLGNMYENSLDKKRNANITYIHTYI
jgi:hypothetical protein